MFNHCARNIERAAGHAPPASSCRLTSFTRPAIVGVLGPNGSGKTTLFELITGSNMPTAGSVQVAGQDIHRVRRNERGQRRGITTSRIKSGAALEARDDAARTPRHAMKRWCICSMSRS